MRAEATLDEYEKDVCSGDMILQGDRVLLYRTSTFDRMMAVAVTTDPILEVGEIRQLFGGANYAAPHSAQIAT